METVRRERGAMVSKSCLTKHRKTTRHANLMADPHYYDRERITMRALESGKTYYENHREKRKEQSQQWKDERVERVIETRKKHNEVRVVCECGVEVVRHHLSDHVKTEGSKDKMNAMSSTA